MAKKGSKGKKLEVILSTQSFRDAGGSEGFPGLEVVGPVRARFVSNETYVKSGDEIDRELQMEAFKKNMSHVFGVEYKSSVYGHPSNEEYTRFAIGTGYRPKK